MVPGLGQVALDGQTHRQICLTIQPIGESPGELVIDMLDDDDRRGKRDRKLAQDFGQRTRSSRRSADGDQQAAILHQ